MQIDIVGHSDEGGDLINYEAWYYFLGHILISYTNFQGALFICFRYILKVRVGCRVPVLQDTSAFDVRV